MLLRIFSIYPYYKITMAKIKKSTTEEMVSEKKVWCVIYRTVYVNQSKDLSAKDFDQIVRTARNRVRIRKNFFYLEVSS